MPLPAKLSIILQINLTSLILTPLDQSSQDFIKKHFLTLCKQTFKQQQIQRITFNMITFKDHFMYKQIKGFKKILQDRIKQFRITQAIVTMRNFKGNLQYVMNTCIVVNQGAQSVKVPYQNFISCYQLLQPEIQLQITKPAYKPRQWHHTYRHPSQMLSFKISKKYLVLYWLKQHKSKIHQIVQNLEAYREEWLLYPIHQYLNKYTLDKIYYQQLIMKLLLKRNDHLTKLCTDSSLQMLDNQLRIVKSIDIEEQAINQHKQFQQGYYIGFHVFGSSKNYYKFYKSLDYYFSSFRLWIIRAQKICCCQSLADLQQYLLKSYSIQAILISSHIVAFLKPIQQFYDVTSIKKNQKLGNSLKQTQQERMLRILHTGEFMLDRNDYDRMRKKYKQFLKKQMNVNIEYGNQTNKDRIIVICQIATFRIFKGAIYSFVNDMKREKQLLEQFNTPFMLYLFQNHFRKDLQSKFPQVKFAIKTNQKLASPSLFKQTLLPLQKQTLLSLQKQSDLRLVKQTSSQLQKQSDLRLVKQSWVQLYVKFNYKDRCQLMQSLHQMQHKMQTNIDYYVCKMSPIAQPWFNIIRRPQILSIKTLTCRKYKINQDINIFVLPFIALATPIDQMLFLIDQSFQLCKEFMQIAQNQNIDVMSLFLEFQQKKKKKPDRIKSIPLSKHKYIGKMVLWYNDMLKKHQMRRDQDIQKLYRRYQNSRQLHILIPQHAASNILLHFVLPSFLLQFTQQTGFLLQNIYFYYPLHIYQQNIQDLILRQIDNQMKKFKVKCQNENYITKETINKVNRMKYLTIVNQTKDNNHTHRHSNVTKDNNNTDRHSNLTNSDQVHVYTNNRTNNNNNNQMHINNIKTGNLTAYIFFTERQMIRQKKQHTKLHYRIPIFFMDSQYNKQIVVDVNQNEFYITSPCVVKLKINSDQKYKQIRIAMTCLKRKFHNLTNTTLIINDQFSVLKTGYYYSSKFIGTTQKFTIHPMKLQFQGKDFNSFYQQEGRIINRQTNSLDVEVIYNDLTVWYMVQTVKDRMGDLEIYLSDKHNYAEQTDQSLISIDQTIISTKKSTNTKSKIENSISSDFSIDISCI